jgi:hypothetical protein
MAALFRKWQGKTASEGKRKKIVSTSTQQARERVSAFGEAKSRRETVKSSYQLLQADE